MFIVKKVPDERSYTNNEVRTMVLASVWSRQGQLHQSSDTLQGTWGWVVWWMCFLGRVERKLLDFGGNLIKKTFYICGITFLIQGAKENCCLFCASMPEYMWLSKVSLPNSGLDPACVESQPAYRRIWDFFPPSPIFSVFVQCKQFLP